MPAFSCPHCHALTLTDEEAVYYWCGCGQPLTVAHTVPGMADGVAGEVSRGPSPRLDEDSLPREAPALPLEAEEFGDPTEVEVDEIAAEAADTTADAERAADVGTSRT